MTEKASIATRVRRDFMWASGLVRLAERRRRGTHALIGFERICDARRDAFQPQRDLETTPATLDRLIRALKRWRVDIVSIDEACVRLAEATAHRFVSLSFNGIYRDVVQVARPVLARHGVPYTVYVPSAFPDDIAEAWWLALQAVIAPRDRVSLVIDGKDMHFVVGDAAAKTQLYHYLHHVMRALPPSDLTPMIRELCTRYGVDLRALTRDAAITWDDLATLAADPQVTIGSATVNYPVLANLDRESARREIAMGRAVLETALQRPIPHVAFPFGDAASLRPVHAELAREVQCLSAVTAIPAMLDASSDLHRLPRLVWTRSSTLRGLRVRLAGY